MSIVSTCQISGKFRRAICLLEGRAREAWDPVCALVSIWEGKKFLHQKQHKLGGGE